MLKRYEEIHNTDHEQSRMKVRKEGKWVEAKPAIANEKKLMLFSSLQSSLYELGKEHDENADEHTQAIYLAIARQMGEILA